MLVFFAGKHINLAVPLHFTPCDFQSYTHVSVTRTPFRRGANAEAEAMRATRSKIVFIMVLYVLTKDYCTGLVVLMIRWFHTGRRDVRFLLFLLLGR